MVTEMAMDLDSFLEDNEPGKACMICRQYGEHEAHAQMIEWLERKRAGESRVTPRNFIQGFLIEGHGLKGCATTWNQHIRECLGYGDVFRGGK